MPFPQAQTLTPPERAIRIPIARGEEATVASYRFKPRPGLTRWFTQNWCGITIATGPKTSKPILVIGTGETGSVTCLGLKDAGAMPPDGPAKRIGLVYSTASPNHSGTTPVLLVSNPATGKWTINHDRDDEFSRILPAPNLASMRRILSSKHH